MYVIGTDPATAIVLGTQMFFGVLFQIPPLSLLR